MKKYKTAEKKSKYHFDLLIKFLISIIKCGFERFIFVLPLKSDFLPSKNLISDYLDFYGVKTCKVGLAQKKTDKVHIAVNRI